MTEAEGKIEDLLKRLAEVEATVTTPEPAEAPKPKGQRATG